MYKIFKLPIFILLSMLTFTACTKDGNDLELQDGKFLSAPALTANINSLVLMQSAENDSGLRLTWANASFGENPQISYSLQLDIASDTAAPGSWANAKNYPLGSNINKYAFRNKDLNAVLNEMHLPNDVEQPIVFRIKADVNPVGGGTSIVPPAYSNSLGISLTSYGITLRVPGEYQIPNQWAPWEAQIFPPITGKTGLFEGYANFTGGGTQYFKFTNAPDWDHTNYGDGGNGTFSTDGAAGGLYVPGPGYYMLTADLNTNRWTVTKTVWAIIGDATPNGWDNETQMTFDAASQTWKITLLMKHNGSFKFRANNAWAIDFGIDNNGKLIYADNPFLGYTPNLNNLTVPEDGTYNITLDLHESQNYKYVLQKL